MSGTDPPRLPPPPQTEAAEVGPEVRREVGPLERDVDGRLEPAHRRAGVVAGALELVGVDRLLLHECLDGIGELDLAAGAALGLLELVEDLGGQDVAADDREARWGVLLRRLLDDPAHAPEAAAVEGGGGRPAPG